MLFAYNCVDKEGKFFDGVIHEDSVEAAREKLEGNGWQILQLEVSEQSKKKKKPRRKRRGAETIGPSSDASPQSQKVVKTSAPASMPREDLRVFTIQMATMLGAGVPLLPCLQTLSDIGESSSSGVIAKLHELLTAGHSFSNALKKLKPNFDDTYISLVRASEQSGRLDKGFHALAERVEREAAIRGRLWQALTYPFVVSLVSLSMLGFLLYYMFPKFAEIFTQSGRELPLITQLVMKVSTHSLPILLTILLVAQVLFSWTRETEKGQSTFRSLLLYESPWLGSINRKIGLSELARDMAMMLEAGNSLGDVLGFSAKQARGDKKLTRSLDRVHRAVMEGSALSEAMSMEEVFPQMMVTGAGVGMEAGRLTEWLERSADSLEMEVTFQIQTLTDLLEPLILGVLGMGVGLVVLAAFLPIYDMISVNL